MVNLPVICKVTQPINAYTEVGAMLKATLHKEGKRFLRDVAKELELEKSEFEIRSNQAGIAVSGEVTLHTDRLYIQIAESGMSQGIQILYRTCSGRKDYSGGQNRFISAVRFYEERGLLADWLRTISQMQKDLALPSDMTSFSHFDLAA